MVRLGLIGCGNVTENRHLPALKQVKGIEVVAVADTNNNQLNKVADRFYIKKRFVGLSHLLDDPDVEAGRDHHPCSIPLRDGHGGSERRKTSLPLFAVSRSDEWDDVSATVNARMTNGIPVTSAFSEATTTNKEIQIYGQAGSLAVSLYRFDGLKFIPKSNPPGGIVGRLQEIMQTIGQIPNALSNRKWGGIHNPSFAAEWQHFADCLQRDIQPECTLEDGKKALQATLAAMESASSGKPVHIPGKTVPSS